MSMPEQSGDSFDFCVLFRVYFTGKGAIITKVAHIVAIRIHIGIMRPKQFFSYFFKHNDTSKSFYLSYRHSTVIAT